MGALDTQAGRLRPLVRQIVELPGFSGKQRYPLDIEGESNACSAMELNSTEIISVFQKNLFSNHGSSKLSGPGLFSFSVY